MKNLYKFSPVFEIPFLKQKFVRKNFIYFYLFPFSFFFPFFSFFSFFFFLLSRIIVHFQLQLLGFPIEAIYFPVQRAALAISKDVCTCC